MNVGQLKQRLNGWKDDAPVLMEDFMMREVHEVKSVNHDNMCEWVQQQMQDVCVLSKNENRKPAKVNLRQHKGQSEERRSSLL